MAGNRLDKLLAGQFSYLSRSQITRAIQEGKILVNGQPAKPSLETTQGQKVFIDIFEPKIELVSETDSGIPVVYEDDYIVVINKPAGLVVHPAAGNWSGTVVNKLLGKLDLDGSMRPGVVHRLDKDTSGLLIIAKTMDAKNRLAELFKKRQIQKKYTALLHGRISPAKARIKLPVGRSNTNPTKMVVRENGKASITDYRVVEYLADYSLVEARLITGRTHQLRVHFAHLGFPIVGDRLYGRKDRLPRQFLHAGYLRFRHPFTDSIIELKSPLPADLNEFLKSQKNA